MHPFDISGESGTRMKRAVIVASLFLAIALILLFLWRGPATRLVFNVPAGFSGPFIIVQDPGGIELSRDWGLVSVTVPPSGIVRVRSLDELEREWRTIAAVKPDGTMFPFAPHAAEIREADVALRGFRFLREHVDGKDVSSFELCVGTASDDLPSDYQTLRRTYRSAQSQVVAPNRNKAP